MTFSMPRIRGVVDHVGLVDERQVHVAVEVVARGVLDAWELVALAGHHVVDLVEPPCDPTDTRLHEHELEVGCRSRTPVSTHIPSASEVASCTIGMKMPRMGVGSRLMTTSRPNFRPMWRHTGRPVSWITVQSGS